MGRLVDVKLYRPREGSKEFTGELTHYGSGDVTINMAGREVCFEKKEIAQVRLHIEF